jgi:hypothetical protein
MTTSNTTPQKRTRRTKEELKDVYIDPIEMEALIQEYYETDVISEKLAAMIQMMQGDAIVKMMTALRRKRFKCSEGYNPFSYFTKVAYHAFQNCIKKSKKDFDTLKRYREETYENHICDGYIPSRKNTRHESSDDYTSNGHYES